MSLENKILEQRLTFKESVVGVSSLSRCAKSLQKVKTTSSESTRATLDSFIRELLLFRLEYEKARKCSLSIDNQKDEYDGINQNVTDAIGEAKEEILRLKDRLEKVTKIKEHRLECEALSTTLQSLNKRSYLKQKMSELSEGIDKYDKSIEQFHSEIGIRQKQWQEVIALLTTIQAPLSGGTEEPEAQEDENEREGTRYTPVEEETNPKTEEEVTEIQKEEVL